jgi:hypothetical protein
MTFKLGDFLNLKNRWDLTPNHQHTQLLKQHKANNSLIQLWIN